MSYFLPDGAKLYMSTGFDAAKAVSAVTNTNPAVASATAHGYNNADELLFTSGWEDATDTIWRAANKTTDALELAGLDSSDTNLFAAGSGAGSLQKVQGWAELQQWVDSADQGGDARFVEVNPISRRNGLKLFGGFNAMSFDLQFGYDQSLASQIAMIAASRTGAKRAFKVVAQGMVGYFYGHIGAREMPTLTRAQEMRLRAAVTVLGRFIAY